MGKEKANDLMEKEKENLKYEYVPVCSTVNLMQITLELFF